MKSGRPNQRVTAELRLLHLKKAKLHEELRNTDDDDAAEVIEWQVKLLRDDERTLQGIRSALQSILKVP